MNDEAREALKAVLDAWHAEDRNMERTEPGYLEKVRCALAGASGEAHGWNSTSVLAAELAREREKTRALLEALKTAETLIAADIVRDDAGCLARIRAAIAKAEAEG